MSFVLTAAFYFSTTAILVVESGTMENKHQKIKQTAYTIAILIVLVLILYGMVVIRKKDEEPVDDGSSTFTSDDTEAERSEIEDIIEKEIEKEVDEFVYPTSAKAEGVKQAQELNSDVKGWLEVPNTNINHPIMQTDDNSFYLNHDENKEYSVWGSYFADYYSTIDSVKNLTQNTVIYGHTGSENPDGEKFSELFAYLDMEHLKENPYIYLTIDEKQLPFEIFAVFYSDIDFYYINPTPSDMPFDYFLEEVNKRNEFVFTDTEVLETDKLLTLSGCSYKYDTNDTGNHRFVIMAKLVEEERENIEIEVNDSPLKPEP